jgi:hypothetical protein
MSLRIALRLARTPAPSLPRGVIAHVIVHRSSISEPRTIFLPRTQYALLRLTKKRGAIYSISAGRYR